MRESGYQLDQGNLAGQPGKGEVPIDPHLGLHDDNLFDQDEDGAGSRVDDATGKAIDNSTYTGYEGVLPHANEHPPELDEEAFEEDLLIVADALGFATVADFLEDLGVPEESQQDVA